MSSVAAHPSTRKRLSKALEHARTAGVIEQVGDDIEAMELSGHGRRLAADAHERAEREEIEVERTQALE
eukprot:tig00021795_g23518.t1